MGSAYNDRPLLHVRHILDESFWEIWRNGQVETGREPETTKAVFVVGRFRTNAAVFWGKKTSGSTPSSSVATTLLHSSSHDACMHVLAVGAWGLLLGGYPALLRCYYLLACLLAGEAAGPDHQCFRTPALGTGTTTSWDTREKLHGHKLVGGRFFEFQCAVCRVRRT